MADNISKKLQTSVKLDSLFLSRMYMMIPYFMKESNHRIVTIEPVIAGKYRFDLEGLLRYEFNVDREFIPMTIILNGYTCSTDYKGDKLTLRIHKQGELASYILGLKE